TDKYITARFEKYDVDQKEWLATRIGALPTTEKEIMTPTAIQVRLDAILEYNDPRLIPAREKLLIQLSELPPHDMLPLQSELIAAYEREVYALTPSCHHESLEGAVTC